MSNLKNICNILVPENDKTCQVGFYVVRNLGRKSLEHKVNVSRHDKTLSVEHTRHFAWNNNNKHSMTVRQSNNNTGNTVQRVVLCYFPNKYWVLKEVKAMFHNVPIESHQVWIEVILKAYKFYINTLRVNTNHQPSTMCRLLLMSIFTNIHSLRISHLNWKGYWNK